MPNQTEILFKIERLTTARRLLEKGIREFSLAARERRLQGNISYLVHQLNGSVNHYRNVCLKKLQENTSFSSDSMTFIQRCANQIQSSMLVSEETVKAALVSLYKKLEEGASIQLKQTEKEKFLDFSNQTYIKKINIQLTVKERFPLGVIKGKAKEKDEVINHKNLKQLTEDDGPRYQMTTF